MPESHLFVFFLSNGDSSCGSDVREHVEVERHLNHDLNNFEMVYLTGQIYSQNLALKEMIFLSLDGAGGGRHEAPSRGHRGALCMG